MQAEASVPWRQDEQSNAAVSAQTGHASIIRLGGSAFCAALCDLFEASFPQTGIALYVMEKGTARLEGSRHFTCGHTLLAPCH